MQFRGVLVLGATGRIGRLLRQYWSGPAVGQAVRWQARAHTRAAQPGQGWVCCDPLEDAAGLARAARGCAAILCLSGVTPMRHAAGAAFAQNAALACAAVRAAAATGACRVLLASSAAVYGNRSGDLSEDTPLAPLSDYGRAKADMEAQAALLGSDLGVAVTSLRIGNIAGIDAILGGWHPGFRLDRFADGRTPARSYIGPRTLARVLGDLLGADGLPGVLNIAGPGVVEMGALLDAAGLAWDPRPAPDTAIARVALDVTRLRAFTALPAQASLPHDLVAEWRETDLVT